MNLYLVGIEGSGLKGEKLTLKEFALICDSVINAEEYVRKRFTVEKIRYAVKAYDGKYIVASTFLDTNIK